MTDDIVAVLLGDAMPPERLGELLRAGRKRRGWKRKHAAAMVRISPDQLRAYEAGSATIPADVCALLAECYGEDLTAHVPLRVAPELDGTTLTVAGVEQSLADASAETVVAGYVDVVQRLRRTKPGEPLPLRTADLTVIAAVLETDAESIEQKIIDVLGCTRAEARSLHRELLRRRVVLPVAGLAASVVALAGVQVAHAMSNDSAPSTRAGVGSRARRRAADDRNHGGAADDDRSAPGVHAAHDDPRARCQARARRQARADPRGRAQAPRRANPGAGRDHAAVDPRGRHAEGRPAGRRADPHRDQQRHLRPAQPSATNPLTTHASLSRNF